MAKEIKFYGDAILSTGQKKFGPSSLELGGSGDYVESSLTSEYNFSNLDYSVDGFYYFTQIASEKNVLFSKEDAGGKDYILSYEGSTNRLSWEVSGLSSPSVLTVPLSINQWYYIEASRSYNKHYISVDLVNNTGVLGDINVGHHTNGKFIVGHTVDPNNVSKKITIGGKTLALTSEKYVHGDGQDSINQVKTNIKNELGEGWALASWSDFEDFTKLELKSILEAFGVIEDGNDFTNDRWMGWVQHSDSLTHFQSYHEGRSFIRCFLAAYHNQSVPTSFEDYSDYHDNYWSLGSWVGELPYVVIKTNSQGDSEYKDFEGFVDEFRVSKGISRGCPTCTHTPPPPAAEHKNDSNTSLLLHFDGAHGDITTRDSSAIDLVISPPSLEIESITPSSGAKGDLIMISGKALNKTTQVHLSGIDEARMKLYEAGSILGSSHPSLPDFSKVGGTGLYFK